MHWEEKSGRDHGYGGQHRKILAMVSGPSYDPNTIAQDWEALNADSAYSPLLNRVTQGHMLRDLPLKIVTALEYERTSGLSKLQL